MDYLSEVTALGNLAVISTLRADGTIQTSLVNAGMLPHPNSGDEVLGFVIFPSVKLRNLRARPRATATFQNGPAWAAVEGTVELAGPDDPQIWLDPQLFRDIFTAAGGTHDDWAEYDRVMVAERRVAVLLTPSRIYSN